MHKLKSTIQKDLHNENGHGICWKVILKIKTYKLYNNKYMIVLITQITNSGILEFIVVLVFKLFSGKVLFIIRKLIDTVKKKACFFNANFTGKLLQNYINSKRSFISDCTFN